MRVSVVVYFLLLFAIYHETECAKRIDVKTRMIEGLAKRELRKENINGRSLNVNLPYTSQFRRSTAENEEVAEVEEVLGLQTGEHLDKTDEISTAAGTKKEKLVETYNELPVIGEGVVVEVDRDGQYTGEIEGNLIEGIAEDIPSTRPTLDVFEALTVAVDNEEDDVEDVVFDQHKDAKLSIYAEKSPTTDVQPRLVWQLNYRVYSHGLLSRPFYIIDANNGDIIKYWEGMASVSWKMMASEKNLIDDLIKILTEPQGEFDQVKAVGGNLKTGVVFYGTDRPSLEVWKVNDTCYLENARVKIVDLNNTEVLSGNESLVAAASFPCQSGNIDVINDGYSVGNDAYYYANAIYDSFMDAYGIPPIQGKIYVRIHFGKDFDNANWDGKSLTFGDGDKVFYPVVALDVMAHELAHGLTEQHSSLVYSGQSGGINEAFSDMTGETMEAMLLGDNDFMIGVDVTKKDEPLRYLMDPSMDNHSLIHAHSYCPGIDVHFSSGIYNKVFYELINTAGWDIKDAYEVFLVANRLYWGYSTNFAEGACGVRQAAEDKGFVVQDVIDAFNSVGIVPCVSNPTGLLAMTNLQAEAGEVISFTFNADSDYKSIRFDTRLDVPYLKVKPLSPMMEDVDMAVTDPNSKLYKGVGIMLSQEVVTVKPAMKGEYTVELNAVSNFTKLSVYAYTNMEVIAEDLTFNDTYNTTFNVPEGLSEKGMTAMLRLDIPGILMMQWPKIRLLVRHENPVDVKNRLYDFEGEIRVHTMTVFRQTILCIPHPGLYHVTVTSPKDTNVTGLSLEYMELFVMRRVNGSPSSNLV